MKRNEKQQNQMQRQQQRLRQRKLVIGSFALLITLSIILLAWMIQDCVNTNDEDTSSTGSGRQDSGISADMENNLLHSQEPETSVPISDGPNVPSQDVGKTDNEELRKKDIDKQDKDGDEGEKVEGNDGLYLPLQIEETKSDQEINATLTFFKDRIPFLSQTMKESGFFFSEKILDPGSGTKAYILAKNENCASNLNAYFYYLFDETKSAHVVSPFVLNLSQLFDEGDRKAVVDSGTFAEPEHAQALRMSLNAALGRYYDVQVYDFILKEYKRLFQDRIAGKPLQAPAFKLELKGLEVVFHHSFLTYVEFFIQA